MSSIDFERLDAAITRGFERPAEFNMLSWFGRWTCGTTACLAGTAALLDGWRPVFDDDFVTTSTVERDGKTEEVEDVATVLLGLDFDQTVIFEDLDIHAVIRRRNEWAREAGVPERTWGSA